MIARRLDGAERTAWLRLARSESVGSVTFAHLIGRFGAPGAAIAALPDLARRGGRAAAPRIPTVADAERELAAGAAIGAHLVAACEPDFPRLLRVLDPPPPLIWVLGDTTLLNRRLIAIVGARTASAAGVRFAAGLAAELGAAGYGIVSGLARGIDAAAHRGSLEAGAVAVLAGGVDEVYPPENGDLYDAIRAKGCLVSEREIGHNARAADFPRRNRLISGLALGVIVVEAELRSDLLITARLAAEQGREVFAVPGSPLDPRSKGANALIRQGATLVEEARDVLDVLEAQSAIGESERPDYQPEELSADPAGEAVRTAVWDLLSHTPTAIDEIARSAGAPVAEVLAALTELAVAGRADLIPGGFAVRS